MLDAVEYVIFPIDGKHRTIECSNTSKERRIDLGITVAQLAFLSPKIQAAILDGSQPPKLTLKRLASVTHPLDWAEHERIFGF